LPGTREIFDAAAEKDRRTGSAEKELALVVEGVYLRYGRGPAATEALRGVNLAVRRGEMVAVMGPSGSGKSSLLHVIGLMIRPTRADRFEIEGIDLLDADDSTRTRVRREKIGFVFQRLNLIPVLSARDNVKLAMWLRRARDDGDLDGLFERLGIADLKRKMPGELSVGQQQRVAIARAIAGGPSLLLADEPTGNLDSENAKAVLDLLRTIHQQRGLTTVLVTHDPAVAERADRILRLCDGKIVDEA